LRRKQSGFGGQTKPVFHKKAKTTKKIVLRMQCADCKGVCMKPIKRCKVRRRGWRRWSGVGRGSGWGSGRGSGSAGQQPGAQRLATRQPAMQRAAAGHSQPCRVWAGQARVRQLGAASSWTAARAAARSTRSPALPSLTLFHRPSVPCACHRPPLSTNSTSKCESLVPPAPCVQRM